ncbi:hypothetical protein KIN20_011660 [Parelaphostrongylus tenuis]|uniref:Uncharacterized protein n=1 Tax=Parelaphostrongylus tenuis TaxID=148309 RepID=A0AAD5MSD8_PARTN|nr:hypothetical protein KIN20_011660 [Parelaphostrongylus tenuis]
MVARETKCEQVSNIKNVRPPTSLTADNVKLRVSIICIGMRAYIKVALLASEHLTTELAMLCN